jgi:hypothetical protein
MSLAAVFFIYVRAAFQFFAENNMSLPQAGAPAGDNAHKSGW